MNLEKFKKKLINFIMKKWTCPVICGICIVLIFAMSANSFAKYYTRVQEERAASVAIYSPNVVNDEQFWTKGYSGNTTQNTISQSNQANGCVRVYMGDDNVTANAKLPYVNGIDSNAARLANRSCQISVTNKANGKVCEIALSYTITIEFPHAMPNKMTWHLKDSSGNNISDIVYEAISYDSSDYYKVGYVCRSATFTLSPGVEEVDTYLIVFSEQDGFVSAESTDSFFDDIRVSIQVTQITR